MYNPIIAQIQKECEQFPSIVKQAKKQQGKTLQDIAEATGVPISHLSKYFSGNLANPNLYNAVAVCKYLGISLDKAFNLADQTENQADNINNLELEYLKKDNQHLKEALKNRQMIIAALLGIIFLLITYFCFELIYTKSKISLILIYVVIIAIVTTVIIIILSFRKGEYK